MVEHRQEFQRDLEAIEVKVIELFAMVAEDLPKATQALLNSDNEVLAMLAEREQVIDALYPEIEELANREILLQAPVAADLRFLLSVLRIVPELERSHDLVVHIAASANHLLGEDLTPRAEGSSQRMGDLAAAMWRQAADSWYQRDRSAARALAERDEEHGRAARQPDRRTRLGRHRRSRGDGDGAGRAGLRASWRARRQHRAARRLPRGLLPDKPR